MSQWYRVIDPQSPLFGCDVRGEHVTVTGRSYLNITSMRRVDLVVGDRPFQLIAPLNETLGLLIDSGHLGVSQIQDDIVEMTREIPYGEFIEERTWFEGDYDMTVVMYGRALQAALRNGLGGVVAKQTWINGDMESIVNLRERLHAIFTQQPVEEVIEFMERGEV